jgi:outer membrane protein assembly factor BamB
MHPTTTKRTFLSTVGSGLLAGGLLTQTTGTARAQSAADGGSWPQYGYDAGNTAYSPTGQVPDAGVTESIRLQTGSSTNSQPVVHEGAMFVGDGRLLAKYDLSNGQLLWRKATEGRVSTAAVAGDRVLVGSDGGTLYAFGRNRGDLLWKYSPGGAVSSPAIDGDIAFIASSQKSVYSIELESGSVRRETEISQEAGDGLAASKGIAVFRMGKGDLHAIRVGTYRELWHRDMYAEVDASPIIADETVYAGDNQGRVRAHDLYTGEKEWIFDAQGDVQTAPAFANGTVFVGSSRKKLFAIDASDGSQKWVLDLDGWVHTQPIVTDDTVIATTSPGTVYAVDSSAGSVRWTYELNGIGDAPPTVVDGTLYLWDGQAIIGLSSPETPTPTSEPASTPATTPTETPTVLRTPTQSPTATATASETPTSTTVATATSEPTPAITREPSPTAPASTPSPDSEVGGVSTSGLLGGGGLLAGSALAWLWLRGRAGEDGASAAEDSDDSGSWTADHDQGPR